MTDTTIDVTELTVEQVQSGFASGAMTSESLTAAFLERIAKFNPRYNAIIFLNPDALDDARAIDARRAAGETLGPLAGVPVVVKDTMDMAGFPTTAGWTLLYSPTGGVDLMPSTDSPVVARMRAAGCVILGKTNVPVLSATGSHANDSWAGPTLNAVDVSFMPGGSSAGTATAVGASMAVLGLAEETGGSIQNPASAQALVGIKPTFALVPNAGVMPLAGSTRDVVGPIARCVRDAALTLDALAGFSEEDLKTVAGVGMKPPVVTRRACVTTRSRASGWDFTVRAGVTGGYRKKRLRFMNAHRKSSKHAARSWLQTPSPAAASQRSASLRRDRITSMHAAWKAFRTTCRSISSVSVPATRSRHGRISSMRPARKIRSGPGAC